MLGAPILPTVSENPSLPVPLDANSDLLTVAGWTSIADDMIGGSNNAGESTLPPESLYYLAFVRCQLLTGLHHTDSIAYFCLGRYTSVQL